MSPVRPSPSSGRIRLGISACLLGDQVRYDGDHKRDSFLSDVLGPMVEWVKVCPEIEVGMGTPREPIRLVDEAGTLRLLTVTSGIDHTAAMTTYSARRTAALAGEDLSGYVLKTGSPSCGMTGVKVSNGRGSAARNGVGLFARALRERLPHLPLEEEGRLGDPQLRENFIERVFAYRRLRDLFEPRWTTGGLSAFHAAHELVLIAHSPAAYAALGRLVGGAKSTDRTSLREHYTSGFMKALSAIATPRRHANVLRQAVGHFKTMLDGASRAELRAAIEDYRAGLVPLVVPLTLVRHYVRVHENEYLARQVYLFPHPSELMLRNHV